MSKKNDIELSLYKAAMNGSSILDTSDDIDAQAVARVLLDNALASMISITIAMSAELQSAVLILIREIDAIKDNASLQDLYTAINVVDTISSATQINPLGDPDTHAQKEHTPAPSNPKVTLKKLAKELEIKGPMWGKVLGAVLIIAGILLSIASFATMIPSFGTSGAGVAPGITWTLAGISFFSTSIGAGLEWGYRDASTNVSTAVDNVAKLF